MQTLNILTIPNETLTKVSEPVVFGEGDSDTRNIMETIMIATAMEHDLFGLAAPQIGVLHRLFVVDLNAGKGEKKFKGFFNPVIKPMKTGNEKVDRIAGLESCASIPNTVCVVVRWNKIKVTALDAAGNEFTMEVSGQLARIIQHEADHLQGVLIVDKAREVRKY